ncbi:MAG: DUF4411 family protein [Candidatus Desantisbacteria bacterium]
MNRANKYLLDANVFIEAHKNYYAFDLCPGFWECLIEYHNNDMLFSIDRVKKEMEDNKDNLSEWIKTSIPPTHFVSTNSQSVIKWYGQMQTWANQQPQFNDEAKAEFANNADCWLVAYAKANSYVLVTHEVFNPKIKRKIPIPNVCQEFGVDYINTFNMLRGLGIRLILER